MYLFIGYIQRFDITLIDKHYTHSFVLISNKLLRIDYSTN